MVHGDGIIGQLLAQKLKRLGLSVAICTKKNHKVQAEANPTRVSAITRASLNILPEMPVEKIAYYSNMSVVSEYIEQNKPKLENGLFFNAQDVHCDYLGAMLENEVILQTLKDDSLQIFDIDDLKEMVKCKDEWQYTFYNFDEKIVFARLVVGADGAHSWLRERCGFVLKTYDYYQQSLIANISVSNHQQTAWQCFTQTGPLAFLPLKKATEVSMVWSQGSDNTRLSMTCSDEAFEDRLNILTQKRFGDVKLRSKRMCFPLLERHVKTYVGDQVVLLGDAAHTVHPLAGLGLNMGIRDVQILTSLIESALLKRRKFYHPQVLHAYASQSKYENNKVMLMIRGIDQMFGANRMSDRLSYQALSWVDTCAQLKLFFMRQAMEV